MPSEVFRPAEAAARLGIAGNTLRVYAARFAPLLSEGAARQSGEPGRRHYTFDDLAILVRAKQLLESGSTYSQALARLVGAQPGKSDSPQSPQVSPEDPPGLAAMQEALAAWRALAEDRGREVAALRVRVSELERIVVELTTPLSSTARRTPLVSTHGAESARDAGTAVATSGEGSSEGELGKAEAPTATKTSDAAARHHAPADDADPTQQPRWWNRLFPGDPGQSGRGAG